MTNDELVKEIEQRIGDTCGLWISDEAAAAALRVCVEELLGCMRPASDEWALIAQWIPERSIYMASWGDVNLLLKNRRARYSPPKSKTPEERVAVVRDLDTNDCFDVYLDGNHLHSFCGAEHVERYRLGVIAELKEQAK